MRVRTLLLTLAVLLAACTSDGDDRTATDLPDDLVLAAALTPFDACDDFLDYMHRHALDLVGPWGLGGGWGPMPMAVDGDMAVDEAADAEAPAERGALQEGVDFSGTNVQEAGVDEPDMVKTDGRLLYAFAQGSLHVVDVRGDEPVVLGVLDLGEVWDASLLLDGDRLLVTSSAEGRVAPLDPAATMTTRPGWWSGTTISLVDVSDPASPRITERLTLDGWTVSSRLVDGVARVVVRSEQPNGLEFEYPEGGGIRSERDATEVNRDIVRQSDADNWIPYFVHETVDGAVTEGPLLDCDDIAHPDNFSGLGTLSVLTVDLAGGGLRPADGAATAVVAGGETVYASTGRLYVATNRWIDWERLDDAVRERRAHEVSTEVHTFDITDPRTATYVASGEVPGRLLNQWALSEHDGLLRVATTVGDAWWDGSEPSESLVTVLEEGGDGLDQVGQVAGLGPTERIYSVRFMGDVGYVVTFRETDPLYTLDLSDPTDPTVTGELKIMGYSAYLHPVGDGLLLGVGQDADERGMTKGTQLSLFDVSDPADPTRLDQVTLGQGSSDVEYDHHAFLHWAPTGLTVVPFSRWDVDANSGVELPSSGAYAFVASRADGIVEQATLSHLAPLTDRGQQLDPQDYEMLWDHSWEAQIRRSVVIGERLFTLSNGGVASHDLDTLADLGWVGFR